MALQHLRSSTADKRPTPAAMSDGQLALNTNLVSPGLFFKDSNGDSVKIGPVHVGTTAPNATPGAGGQAGNSKGEQWLDTSSSRYVFKIWDGTDWRTEDGEFVNASGDTMTGALIMDNQQQVRFRETTGNGTNFIAVQAPASVTADRTLTLPDVTGTIVSTADTGTVTSTMILDETIVNADINASAAIVDTKLATIATAGKVSNSATTATNANTASAIVARDGSGNFTAGTITAALTGAASSNVLKAGDTMTGALVVPLASAATPSLTFTGDLDTGVFSPGANQVAVATNGAQRINIEADGDINIDGGGVFYDATNNRLAIGTTSPGAALHISNGNDSASGEFIGLILGGTNSANARTASLIKDTTTFDLIYRNNNFSSVSGSHVFRNGNSEHARIDSSGRLLVGTSTSTAIAAEFNIQTQANSAAAGIGLIRQGGTTSGNGPNIRFARSRGTSLNDVTVVADGDNLGTLAWHGADGVDFASEAASIQVRVDGTPGANDMPGRLVFSTTADGASSSTERMRITQSGNILFDGNSALPSASVGGLAFAAANNSRKVIYASSTTTSEITLALFLNPNGEVGSIKTNGSATSYNTSSDYRLKENVTAVSDGITRLQQLKPSRFNFIADPAKTVDGFIAHEVQTIVPEAITGEKDAVDDEGNPQYQGIDQSKIVPLLTAALQEAIAKIEALEQRLNDAGIN